MHAVPVRELAHGLRGCRRQAGAAGIVVRVLQAEFLHGMLVQKAFHLVEIDLVVLCQMVVQRFPAAEVLHKVGLFAVENMRHLLQEDDVSALRDRVVGHMVCKASRGKIHGVALADGFCRKRLELEHGSILSTAGEVHAAAVSKLRFRHSLPHMGRGLRGRITP